MDLDAACSHIVPMVAAAKSFDAKVDVVVRHMTDLRCSNEVGVVDHDAVEDALADGPSRECLARCSPFRQCCSSMMPGAPVCDAVGAT